MTKLREIYYCEKCKNVVEIFNEGAEALVCCGEPMLRLEAQTKDSSVEKHVPFVKETKTGVLVKVGENEDHPMLENHYIKFIEVLTKDTVYKAELKPGDSPEAEFPVNKSDIETVREWCNVHGLWKTS